MATQIQAPALVKEPFYRPELDSLRFFAFLAVFLCHTLPGSEVFYIERGIPRALGVVLAAISRAGSYGVDLFFVLSAYLITTLLLREQERTGTVHLQSFYLRRILRIWPLYFLALGITVVWAQFQPSVFLPRTYLVAYLLLAGNWMTAFYGAPPSFMSILWSVSVEEQFYLTWPLALRKLTKQQITVAALMLLIVASLTRWYLAHHDPQDYTIWPNTLARLDPIALGILLSVVIRFIPKLKLSHRGVLLGMGLLLWLVSGHYYSTSVAFSMWGYPAIALGAASLFLCVLGSSLSNPVLVYMGKISYGLYVYHLLALHVSADIYAGRTHSPIWFGIHCLTALCMTVVLAHISYRFWEAPFLRMKERFTYIASRPV